MGGGGGGGGGGGVCGWVSVCGRWGCLSNQGFSSGRFWEVCGRNSGGSKSEMLHYEHQANG